MIEPETVGLLIKQEKASVGVKRNGDLFLAIAISNEFSTHRIYLSRREAEHLRRAISRVIREIKEFEATT